MRQPPRPTTPRRRRAFTLIELLVVISIIALLIAILLPALQSARGTARKLQNSTQLRGIVQASFTHASSNEEMFPGIRDRSRLTFNNVNDSPFVPGSEIKSLPATAIYAGAFTHGRFAILMNDDTIPANYAISPGENRDITPWDQDGNYTAGVFFHSYALLNIAELAVKKATKDRFLAWSSNFMSSSAPIATDRIESPLASINDPLTHRSLWSNQNSSGWEGGIAFGDGHVVFETSSVVEDTQYAQARNRGFDNLFSRQDAVANGGTGFNVDSNAMMAFRGYSNPTAQ